MNPSERRRSITKYDLRLAVADAMGQDHIDEWLDVDSEDLADRIWEAFVTRRPWKWDPIRRLKIED